MFASARVIAFQYRYLISYGTVLVASVVAFRNRGYVLQNIKDDIELMTASTSQEDVLAMEKLKAEFKAEQYKKHQERIALGQV